ncbi:MAG: hypothetical protein GKR96_10255 [Gammaproteobacteria bacterium]|nr:hypothetical protein [Gammaproteobacteria bacterium]
MKIYEWRAVAALFSGANLPVFFDVYNSAFDDNTGHTKNKKGSRKRFTKRLDNEEGIRMRFIKQHASQMKKTLKTSKFLTAT